MYQEQHKDVHILHVFGTYYYYQGIHHKQIEHIVSVLHHSTK